MADFTALKEAIQDAIKQNGQKEITGEVLQTILLSMVSTLGDSAINGLVEALAAAITTLQNSVGDEATARQSAVATLTQNLNTEAQTRAYEDSQLANDIQGEAYVRGQSDNQIRQDFTDVLSEETAARINGDSTLTHNLNVEAQARAAAILNEATIRQGEDYQLRLQINGLSMDFDQLLEDVRQLMQNYRPIVINGNVTNAPDENDLTTTSDNLLKFKDNAYNPIMFSGMGKKFLRKNIRTLSDSYPFDGFVEDINPQEELSDTPAKIFWDREGERFVGWLDGVYYLAWTDDDAYVPVSTENIYMYDGNPYKWNGEDFYVDDEELPNVRNVLTQDMISEANTIYVIRYDYTLGENITIPANCILEFDGGSLSNGTITGNHTTIIGGDYQIFTVGVLKHRGYSTIAPTERNPGYAFASKIYGNDIEISGTWNNIVVNPKWVGLDNPINTEDNSLKLQRYLNLHKEGIEISVPSGVYYCYNPIKLHHSVDFNNSTIIVNRYTDIYDSSIELPSGSYALPDGDTEGLEMVYGLIQIRTTINNSYIKNVTIDGNRDNNTEAIKMGISGLLLPYSTPTNYIFENVNFQNSPSCGLIGGRLHNAVFNNCVFKNTDEHGLYLGGSEYDNDIEFNDCLFENCGDSQSFYDFRGTCYIIKRLINDANSSGSEFAPTFNRCKFINTSSITEKGLFYIQGGNLTLTDCYLQRMTNTFGSRNNSNAKVNIKLIRCENGLGTGAPHTNVKIECYDCTGNISINNEYKLIDNCSFSSTYLGDPNIAYIGECASDISEPIVIKRSNITFVGSAAATSLGNISKIRIEDSHIFDYSSAVREAGIISATPLDGNDTYDIEIISSDINLKYYRISNNITTANVTLTDCDITGHRDYLINSIKQITIDNIRIFNAVLYNTSRTPTVVDNTVRALTFGDDSRKKRGYNNFGVVVNVNGTKDQIDAATPVTPGSQVFCSDLNMPAWWDGSRFLKADGYPLVRVKGTTAQRPTLNDTFIGFKYFDTDLKKEISFNNLDKISLFYRKVSYESLNNFYNNFLLQGHTYAALLNPYRSGIGLYFSKVNSNPSESDLLPIITSNVGKITFTAPNPSTYPYIYFKGTSGGDTHVTIYSVIKWCEYDGAKAGVVRKGITTSRPDAESVYVGFGYFDTTLSKLIYVNSIDEGVITWVDATGATV